MVFRPFWPENGYKLRPVLSGIGYCFGRNYRSVWTFLSSQFQMSKKERKRNMRIQNLWRKQWWHNFHLKAIWSENGCKNGSFWSEIGDLENRAAQPHQEFPGVPPPPGFVVCGVLEKEKLGLGIPHRPTLNSRTVVELDKRVNFNFHVFFFFIGMGGLSTAKVET